MWIPAAEKSTYLSHPFTQLLPSLQTGVTAARDWCCFVLIKLLLTEIDITSQTVTPNYLYTSLEESGHTQRRGLIPGRIFARTCIRIIPLLLSSSWKTFRWRHLMQEQRERDTQGDQADLPVYCCTRTDLSHRKCWCTAAACGPCRKSECRESCCG